MPNRQLEQRRTRTKRLIASAIATLYFFGSEGPMLLTFAAPGWFVRPGAGVSSQPLGVSSFNAPGFGDLAQAVNLANGNVYAAAGGLSFNNQMQSGDENTNKVGGSGWNLTQRLRLNGFSRTSNANFGSDNLTLNPNLASDAYYGYFAKPNVIPVTRFPTQDSPSAPASGCGNGSQSGVFLNTAITPGKYRLTLDARADANMVLLYGLDTLSLVTTAAVTTTWQSFTYDFTVAANTSKVPMAVWEATLNNPAWEVANLRSFRLDASNNPTGANLISAPDQDLRNQSWSPICAKPTAQSFSRLQKADHTGTPGTNYSGIIRQDTALPGTYKVSLEARTRNGSLTVNYGVSDVNYTANVALNTTWKTLSQTYNVTQDAGRVFEIWEQTANNPDWEVRNISVQRTAPGSFTLSSGDGSSRLFKQTTPSFTTVPSWISRYQTTTGTTFYALDPLPGTQYSREWIVLRQIGTNYIAHYYTSDGNRVTFNNDGEYADYVQNPYQQYQGASATTADPEGTAATTPKTEISYTAANSGLISKVKDAWGRVTTYEWNTTDKTLTRVNELLRTETDNTTAARTTAFEYGYCFNGVCGNQRAVTKVTYTAPDGKGGTISRWTTFFYEWRANNTRLMLKNISRAVLGGQTTVQTTYSYDSSDRLIRVDMTDQPSINYTFTMTGTLFRRNNDLETVKIIPTRSETGLEYRVPEKFATDLYEARLLPRANGTLQWTRNGNKAANVQLKRGQRATLGRFNVRPGDTLELRGSQGAAVELIPLLAIAGPVSTNVTVVQGVATDVNRKESQFVFDASGQLTQKKVRDYNPWIPTAPWFDQTRAEKWLTWNYTYNGNGSTASVVSPAGRKDAYTYDVAGNVTKLETFVSTSALTPERATSYTYDLDNRQTNETIAAMSGTRDGASYSYGTNQKTTTYTPTTVTTGGQAFQAITTKKDERVIAGVVKRTFEETYDLSGRMTQKQRRSSGLSTVTTAILYHNGTITWQPYYPSGDGDALQNPGAGAKQYADLPTAVYDGNLRRQYYYDDFGNLNYERFVVSDGSVGALGYDQVSGSTLLSVVARFRSWNGFGQMTWDTQYENPGAGRPDRYVNKRVWNYYATGELDSSWSGLKTNTTDYTYNVSGADLGRVAGVVKGVGDGNGVTTPHESTNLAYDVFGRVVTQTVDGFATTFKFDTLDRTVNTVLPNGLGTAASYHASGIQDFNCNFGGGGSGSGATQGDQNRCSYNNNIDSLGRVGYNNTSVNVPQVRSTYFTYDPFDRPIKVINSALEMVTSSDARATFTVYDTEGNLLRQLSPELDNTGYVDNRRPYVEYDYDAFNRKTVERKLVRSPSPITPSSMTMPSGAGVQIATTTSEFDPWDRAVNVKDADGWTTSFAYDALGNVTQKLQQVCPDTSGECAQHFSDEDGAADSIAITRYAYDAAGRVTTTVDPRGNKARVRYNNLGLPSSISDARGVTVKVMRYTPDGLPQAQWEPDGSAANATYIDSDDFVNDPANYVKTKRWQYGSARKYPTSMDVANMNSSADTGTVYTQYQYDFAGRPTLTTLPGGATIEQGYDGRGHLTRMKDADGFVTEYQYNAWDQLTQEKKLRRGGTIDMTALPGDLVSTYTYDLSGNLKLKNERGLLTDYWYNSLGKVQLESRPHASGVGSAIKYYTYRIDGVKTAETSYGYDGGLITTQRNIVDCWTNTPSVTSGNVQCWGDLTGLGWAANQASFGVSSALNGGTYTRERIEMNTYNGLGLRYKRWFFGDGAMYAAHRTNAGVLNGDGEATLWRYDGNGNVLKSYKRGISGNGGAFTDTVDPSTVSPASPQDASDVFQYTYSPTSKQTSRASVVKAWATSRRGQGNFVIGKTDAQGQGAATVSCTSGTPGTVTPQSVTNLCYSKRDQVLYANVTDYDAQGGSVNKVTNYSYYGDGSKATSSVAGAGMVTFTYDARGRLWKTVDSNGSNASGTPVTTEFTYSGDGTTTEHMPGVALTYRYPTVGGLIGRVLQTTALGFNGCSGTNVTWCDSDTRFEYDASGMPKWTRDQRKLTVSGVAGSPLVSNTNTETRMDGWGNVVERYEDSTRDYVDVNNVKQTGTFAQTRTYFASYTANNSLQSDSSKTVLDVQGNVAQKDRSFSLSSRGLRLNASISQSGVATADFDTDFSGSQKKYDAEDRAVSFAKGWNEPKYEEWGPFGIYFGVKEAGSENQRVMELRYDPFGDLILSVSAKIKEWIWEPYTYRDLEVKSSSSVFLDGHVLLMHNVKFSQKHNVDRSFTQYVTGFSGPAVSAIPMDQDETFTLADGARNDDPSYSVLAPFGAPSVDSSATPLQAPVTPLSTQVRVDPSAIQAPGSNTPPTTDPGGITPPASSTTTQSPQATSFSSGASLAQSTGVSSQNVSSPSVGVQAFSVSGANTNAASTSSNATTASSSNKQVFSSQINLEAPSSVLPPSITPLSASSITSPSSLLIVTPNAGDVSSIVAPSSSVPVVGITPSSGASTIVPPSGSVNDPTSSVTPPGGSSSGIVPPGGSIGGSSGTGVKPLENRLINGNCRFVGDSNSQSALSRADECESTEQSLQEKADFLGETIKTSSGRSAQERADLEFQLAKTRAQRIDVVYPGGSEPRAAASVRAISENPLYQEMSPERKLAFWHVMNYGLGTGQVGRKDLANTAAAMWGLLENKSVLARYPELQTGVYQLGPTPSTNSSSSLAGLGLVLSVGGLGGESLGISAVVGGASLSVAATAFLIVVSGYVAFEVGKELALSIQNMSNAISWSGSDATASELILQAKKTKQSGKESASDVPSWARGIKSDGSSPAKQAEEIMDQQYPDENWRQNPVRLRELSQIKKRLSRTR
jgi:YD repeat-containing protein